MKERIRFTVTQEHIDAGTPFDVVPDRCPIALALHEATGERWLVTPDHAFRYSDGEWTMPRSGVRFQARLFRDKPVAPFTGEVYR